MKHKCSGYCSNVKLHLTTPILTSFSILDEDEVEINNTNIIVKCSNFVFTIYNNSRHKINVTGIRGFIQIPLVKKILTDRTSLSPHFISANIKICNSSWHFAVRHKIDLYKVEQKIAKFYSSLQTRFNPTIFPGLTVRFSSGTAICFGSGKVNILGLKSTSSFFTLKLKVLDIIYNH